MRLYTPTITANTEVRAGTHLIELHAPQLAQSVQPGQYCMLRCCPAQASDPLLRRPFFIHGVQSERGVCTLLVHARGRGSAWLLQQPVGATLDMLGPLGHGWTLRPTVSTLLLISEGPLLGALTLLAQRAIEREVAVTLVSQTATAALVYPPALLSSEVEYQIVTADGSAGAGGAIASMPGLEGYLGWADAVCCAVSRETSAALYERFERLRRKNFAQGLLLRPLACGAGVCLTCAFTTPSGAKLVCRDGPVFDLREIVRGQA